MASKADIEPPSSTAPSASAGDERLYVQLRALIAAIAATPGRGILYLLGASITLVIIATAAMQVVLNAWMRPFYDAVEKKVVAAFIEQLGVFMVIGGLLLILNVVQTGLNQAIRLKLREFATKDLINNWMVQKRAARLARIGQIGINPDQRIHEDANHLTDLSAGLGIGLLQSVLLLVSFIGVLWVLSRGVVLTFMGHSFIIPGYMVWAALIYAATGSWLSWWIGRPLVRLQQSHYAREADLRIALVHGVQQADGIALNNGEMDERDRLTRELAGVLSILWRILGATVRLTVVTSGYGWVALVFPIIVAAPGYFGGALSFGALMMTVGAFNQVQQQLRWFVDNAGTIADWRATLLRVMTFRQALINLDRLEVGQERIEHVERADGHLSLDDISIVSFRGRTELGEKHLDVAPGERVLIGGRPGSGKSTLFLAIAGLWDLGRGRIGLPPVGDIVFMSQKPFIPAGSLRDVLTYAAGNQAYDDATLTSALKRLGLGQLCKSLDRVEGWDTELNFEEQQRLAFARVLLTRPKWVVSDEAIDTIESRSRDVILSVFADELAGTGVVSIAGRPEHNGFYTRFVPLVAHSAQEAGIGAAKARQSSPRPPADTIEPAA
jgi:vitamin B12/bleomycin/antimicrobial peptide transport system ATP-binding/permease protein